LLHLEQLNNKKNNILQKQGEQLAWKARSKWYNEGEKSNKYFLNLLKKNTTNNHLEELVCNGVSITDEKKINEEVIHFYDKLYNANFDASSNEESFLDKMFTLQNHEAALVSSPITLAELWLTLKPLKDTTPGPDGISYAYLKKLWDIIGPLILNAWQCSVEENKMSPSYLKSYLRLIPKVNKDCRHLKNWRPITLSNCDLKIITKTYNNRLISILSNYITTAQTA